MIYQKVLRRLKVTEKELRGRCRRQDLVDARCMMAAALLNQPLTRQGDVAKILNVSQAAISHLMLRHESLLDADESYRKKWEAIIK